MSAFNEAKLKKNFGGSKPYSKLTLIKQNGATAVAEMILEIVNS